MNQSRAKHDYVTLLALVLVDVHHCAEFLHAGAESQVPRLISFLNIELWNPEPITHRQRVNLI